jgi:hypothetical protein
MNNHQNVPTLLVGTAYSANKRRNQLLPMEIGIYRDDNSNAVVGDTPATVKTLTIVQGTAADKHVIASKEISAYRIRTFKGVPYRATVPQEYTLSDFVFNVDKTYHFVIVQKLPQLDISQIVPRWNYTFKPRATETLATFLTRVAEEINLSYVDTFGVVKKFEVTATATTLVITTATPYIDDEFSVTASVYEFTGCYDCGNVNREALAVGEENQPYVRGSGTCRQMQEIEEYFKGYLGYDNRRSFPIIEDDSYIQCPTCYDLLVIEYDNYFHSQATGQLTYVPKPLVLTIASPIESGVLNSILAVLNPYFEETVNGFVNIDTF